MLTVATAIFGPGFVLHQPAEHFSHTRFICFTDQADIHSDRWEIVRPKLALSARRANRHVKALLHRYVPGPTLYVDAEFKIVGDPRLTVEGLLDAASWAATKHPQRDCLFDEAAFCLKKKRLESESALREQVERYRATGIPEHWGLWVGGILARNGDAASVRLGEAWWSEIEGGSERDQVSLPFVAWKLGLRPAEIGGIYTKLPGIARKKIKRKRGSDPV